ncbi:MAG TPA: hypothetical protein VNL39_14175 [Xanthobacteraceae bacterium]|nr:hypothetical protein [Xanthobacteraceae bacterium]
MSSPKATAKATRKAREAQRSDAPRPKVRARTASNTYNGTSVEALRLAQAIQRELNAGRCDALSPEALQSLTAALCNTYAAQVEAGAQHTPIASGQVVSPTAVMVTASGLLRAANLAVFELGMWQSWTGR